MHFGTGLRIIIVIIIIIIIIIIINLFFVLVEIVTVPIVVAWELATILYGC